MKFINVLGHTITEFDTLSFVVGIANFSKQTGSGKAKAPATAWIRGEGEMT
jgi:hypothetical protein